MQYQYRSRILEKFTNFFLYWKKLHGTATGCLAQNGHPGWTKMVPYRDCLPVVDRATDRNHPGFLGKVPNVPRSWEQGKASMNHTLDQLLIHLQAAVVVTAYRTDLPLFLD